MQIQNLVTVTTQTHKIDQCVVNLTLNYSTKEEQLSSNGGFSATSSIMRPISDPSLAASSLIEDDIGVESCIDLKNNDDIFTSPLTVEENQGVHQRCNKMDERKEGFPPPMPFLARTGNLSPHMPWVLRRICTEDGRLILREERVKHHEYFQADRCNGRLTLRLIPLDDEVYPPHPHGFANETEDENELEYCEEELDDCRIEEEEEEEEEEENEIKNCSNEEDKEDKDEAGIADHRQQTQVNEKGKLDEYIDNGVDDFHSRNGNTAKKVVYEDQSTGSVEVVNLSALNIYNSVTADPNCIFGVAVPYEACPWLDMKKPSLRIDLVYCLHVQEAVKYQVKIEDHRK